MKALSIREPWASMILSGRKTIETRTWRTDFRGTVLLCASKSPVGPLSGMAFATARISAVWRMTRDHEAAACCEVYEGAYAWILDEVTPVVPFPVKGALSFFEVDYSVW